MYNKLKSLFVFGLLALSVSFVSNLHGQTIMGRAVNLSNKGVPFVSVELFSLPDSVIKRSVDTDSLGRFRFSNFGKGNYFIKFSNFKYETQFVNFSIDSGAIIRKEIQMGVEIKTFSGAGVTYRKEQASQKNDTVEYNAGSYKVNQDATAENLVTKMPGITNENGTIKAQGEEVKKVTVDGQDFFGSDAAAALKNLPAEIVDKIQVYDRASDQSAFTGIDDGNAQKTLNIVTKSGKNNGQFGKIYGGYGTDSRWAAGGNVNYFKGKNRLSFIGLSNNINQQNFTSSDILGALGQSASGGGMMQGMGRPGMGGGMPNRGGPGGFGGGDMSNFMVNQQGGINTTNSIGLNYSAFGMKKMKITASYFFNNGVNNSASFLNRTYFLNSLSNQLYSQADTSKAYSSSHRINARIEYNLDTNNSIIYTPSIRFQNGRSNSFFKGITKTQIFDTLNQSASNTKSNSNGYNINNNLLLRHKFKKPGQTISLNLSHTLSLSEGLTELASENSFYEPNYYLSNFKQQADQNTRTNDFNPNLSFTQPFKKKSTIEITYNPQFTSSKSYKYTQRLDTILDVYNIVDSLLSNTFNNTTTTQRAGATCKYKSDKFSLNIGANAQTVDLEGNQSFPKSNVITRTFDNILPNAMLTYQPSKAKNLRVYYRSSANIPSISQLQNVVNNSNPLILSSGNLSLQQEKSHRVFMRYSYNMKGKSFFIFGNVATTADYIANNNILAQTDTTFLLNGDSISLRKGTQLNLPVNINGYRNARLFLTYSIPSKKLKSAFNFNLGQTYTKSPAFINNQLNFSNTYNTTAGVVVASNISEKIDFTLSYNINYNIIDNSLQTSANSSYLIANFNAKLNYMPKPKWVFNTDITNSSFTGLGATYNQSIWLINGGLGYKFLKDNRGELKVSVFDALKRNNSISRTVTESYIEDKSTQILTRFYMLTFTYSIRNFKAKK